MKKSILSLLILFSACTKPVSEKEIIVEKMQFDNTLISEQKTILSYYEMNIKYSDQISKDKSVEGIVRYEAQMDDSVFECNWRIKKLQEQYDSLDLELKKY